MTVPVGQHDAQKMGQPPHNAMVVCTAPSKPGVQESFLSIGQKMVERGHNCWLLVTTEVISLIAV